MSGLRVITKTLSDVDANTLRQMGDFLRDKEPAVVAVLAVPGEEKITFLAVCGKEAVARGVKAGELVKLVSGIAGGSGGGKPDSAMKKLCAALDKQVRTVEFRPADNSDLVACTVILTFYLAHRILSRI